MTTVDRGNERVQARAAAFARFRDGRADQQLGDQIGRAWAAGLLDGASVDGAILRDIGRTYAALYWHVFAAMAPKMGAVERRDRGAEPSDDDPQGERFCRLDELARSAGHDAVVAMHRLCVDDWWFPDVDSAWIARMLGAARREDAQWPADARLMQNALAALLAMVDGRAALLSRAA